MKTSHAPVVVVLIALGCAIVTAQGPADNSQTLTFEVASIKATEPGNRVGGALMMLPERLVVRNQTLHALISTAYQMETFRIMGGPAWTTSDRFDISATTGHRVTIDESRQMLRALLEERFKLETHRDTHDARIYVLTFAHDDHKLGPDLKPTTLDCATILAERRQNGTGMPPPTPSNPRPICGASVGNGFHAHGIEIASFAQTLGMLMRETVVDETGLTGWWDFDLEMSYSGFSGPPVGGADSPANTPSIFTALQEQLGLKLETKKGPVDVLVIDHVEKPTED
jgi:uncharacterized protein (TIGR03435 family)